MITVSCKMYNPVKHVLLMLLVMAGALTTLQLFQLKYQWASARTPKKPFFNETLLTHAAIDIGEPGLKQEIDDLLEGKFVVNSRIQRRSFFSSSGNYRRTVRLRSLRNTLLKLGSDELHGLWSTFEKSLSDWWRKRMFYHPGVMSELVGDVKFLIDEYNLAEKGLYSSCAVVGNSGILLNSEHGELIDSHEAVIRLNNARIDGFERNVGSKTNISFVNSNILHECARRLGCFCHPHGDRVPIVLYVCQPVHFADFLVCNSSHRAPLIVTDPRFDVACARIVKYYSLRRFLETTGKGLDEWATAHDGANFHYSSGMQAVMLALGVCKRVSLFGFGKSELARHHYHTRQSAELSLHDYEAEYDFYRDLVAGCGGAPFVSDKFEFPPVVMYH